MTKIVTFIALLALASCGATKKAVKTTFVALDSIAAERVTTEQADVIVDTARSEQGKVTITEIEFFPSVGASPNAAIDIHNVGTVSGTIKSIKQTTIETAVEVTGKTEESSDKRETESVVNVGTVEDTTTQRQEPAPDPYRWRYIFYVALLIAAVLLYLKRMPIVEWIKKILKGIAKILVKS